VNADSYSGYSKCTKAGFSDNNKYRSKESHSQRSPDRERIKQKDTIGKE
jgi:hypothetical protein